MADGAFAAKRFRGAIPPAAEAALRACAEEGLGIDATAQRLGITPWRVKGLGKRLGLQFRDGRTPTDSVGVKQIRAALLAAVENDQTIRDVATLTGSTYQRVYTISKRIGVTLRRDTFERNAPPPARPVRGSEPRISIPTAEQRHWCGLKAHHRW